MQKRFYLKEKRETLEFLVAPVLPEGFFAPKKKAVQNGKLNCSISRNFWSGNRSVGGGSLRRDDAD
ncbi:MAG: hypothetical protein IJY84_05125 [Clostridia bacterium]|nr:hypothetical protein [Clostridia bacterium]